ncbi:hypothetical protein D3C73_1656180 [compost metagenome]
MATESTKETVECCDKSVPFNSDACCGEDAAAKAEGKQGCDCKDNINHTPKSKAACC